MSTDTLHQRIGSCKLPHGYIISLGATPIEYGTVITATKLKGGSYRYLIRSTAGNLLLWRMYEIRNRLQVSALRQTTWARAPEP